MKNGAQDLRAVLHLARPEGRSDDHHMPSDAL
jgi:hypothetical protein